MLAAILIITAMPFAFADSPLAFKKAARLADDDSVIEYYKVNSCLKSAVGTISIPDTYLDLPVLEIGAEAFKDCGGITEVNIPSSVDKIGVSAFENCLTLKKVSYQGSSFESDSRVICDAAFRMCTELETLLLPGGLVEIGESAFSRCGKIKEIALPDTLKTINSNAFAQCDTLTSVAIPASVTAIHTNAFLSCMGLTSFSVSSENKNYKAIDGVLFSADGKTLVQYPVAKSNTVYIVPEGTQTIGNAAFSPSKKLTDIILPDGVKTIQPYAFHRCEVLSNINIPDGVTEIGSMALAYCPALEIIVLPDSVASYSGAFYSSGIVNVILSQGITRIDERAFEKCSHLTGVFIPSSVTEIKTGAFKDCTALTYLEIPESVTTLGNEVFMDCTALTLTVFENSAAHTYAKNNSVPYSLKNTTAVKEMTHITVNTMPSKTEYEKGERISTNGLSITVHYNDGTSGIVYSGFTVTPQTAAYAGTQAVTVTYDGKSVSFDITVKSNAGTGSGTTGISIAKLPSKTSYDYKETLNTSGLVLTVTHADGSVGTVTSGYNIITPTYFDSTGNKTVTVEYDGYTASFTVNVSYSFFQFIIMYICLGFLWGY